MRTDNCSLASTCAKTSQRWRAREAQMPEKTSPAATYGLTARWHIHCFVLVITSVQMMRGRGSGKGFAPRVRKGNLL